jgi:hypothetical protein
MQSPAEPSGTGKCKASATLSFAGSCRTGNRIRRPELHIQTASAHETAIFGRHLEQRSLVR